jgi:IS5 family transposase
MKPKSSSPEPQRDLFKTELKHIIDKNHPLAKLAEKIDWTRFDEAFEPCYSPDFGRPAIPTRLMVSLHYLKYTYDLSDEEVTLRWIENPYWQYFSGRTFFEHKLPLEVSTMCRWRKKVGEAGAEELLAGTIQTGIETGAIKKSDLKRVNVDTTVETKAIRYPTDPRLYDRMRERLVAYADEHGIELRQSYRFVGKRALHRHSGYARAQQFRRAKKETRKLKTYLRRVLRDVLRKVPFLDEELTRLAGFAHRLLLQKRDDKNKLYSIHAPEVECISKGKVHKRFEFGCKVGVVTTARKNWILGAKAYHGNPYDGHTLRESIEQAEQIADVRFAQATCDMGYRGHNYEGECEIGIVQRMKRAKNRWKRYWWNRRSAIEPIIGHLKAEHRLERNILKSELGDKLNAIFSACGYNLKKLIRAFLRRYFGWFEERFLFGIRSLSPILSS